MSPEAQWFAQLICLAVAWWALHKLAVEVITGLAVVAWRHYRTRGGPAMTDPFADRDPLATARHLKRRSVSAVDVLALAVMAAAVVVPLVAVVVGVLRQGGA